MTAAADGARLAVRLTPRARAARIDGIEGGRLKVAVTAPPAENQANEALLRLLAKEWRLPQSSLSITVGATSRNKIVRIAGDPAALIARLSALFFGGRN
ncbi:MAG TPA: DUF167 domain-containing protein [Stellaceae bacterium]|nr:DUF167 domain-containing protein [Stellaceae bacterium]